MKTKLLVLLSLFVMSLSAQVYQPTFSFNVTAKGQTSFVVTDPNVANRVGVFTVSAPIPALTGFALRFNRDMQFIPVMPF